MLRLTRRRLVADILSGVELSREIRRRVATEAQLLSRPPCLAVVLVGDRPDSHRYVRHKRTAAAACGIDFRLIQLPETISQHRLHKELVAVNSDSSVDGVLLQLPLPPHLRARPALFHIHPGKDVDGLHPLNAGNLFLRDSSPLADVITDPVVKPPAPPAPSVNTKDDPSLIDESLVVATNEGAFSSIARWSHERKYFIPCTALAVRTLIVSYLNRRDSFFHRDSTGGRPRHLHAVVVNTSMVVGVPTTALLQKERGFVVSTCNRSTPLEAIKQLSRTADVLVTAYGQANVFDAEFVKKGAIVVDVAINERTPDVVDGAARGGSCEGRQRPILCGDVDFASVKDVARAITPVPGGVGPLTVAHLMQNVLKAARLRHDTRLYYNNVYASFVKMYGETSRETVPVGSTRRGAPVKAEEASPAGTDTTATAVAAAFGVATRTEGEASTAAPPNALQGEDEEDEVVDFTDNGNFDC